VLANGNVTSSEKAAAVLAATGAAGVMIGRHAIRNPWIFRQCRERFAQVERDLRARSEPVQRPDSTLDDSSDALHRPAVFQPTLADVRGYVEHLYRATRQPDVPESAHVAKMKKYLNFVGQSVDPAGAFLHDMRRAMTGSELFAVCDRHLLAEPARLFSAEPYPGIIARPNCETPVESCSLDSITA
jgi:tRNA-dihydrouridine synthase